MLRILSIGNSFSDDAHRYLHAIAQAGGVEVLTYNLYIGGCSLRQHWENYQSGAEVYALKKNGAGEGETCISVNRALQFDAWDVVTLQQASHFSGRLETYHPFLEHLVAAVRAQAPAAQIFLHETWAYGANTTHPAFADYGSDCETMFCALDAAYRSAAEALCLPLIPVGPALRQAKQALLAQGLPADDLLYRDGFHLHLNYGRYLAAAVWYQTLCGEHVDGNTFTPQDAGIANPELLQIIRSVL